MYSTVLRSVGTEFKVVLELVRHSTLRSTLDVYTQAITPAKHAAQAPCCHWFFQRELMEPRSHLQMLTLQRDENLRRAKRTLA